MSAAEHITALILAKPRPPNYLFDQPSYSFVGQRLPAEYRGRMDTAQELTPIKAWELASKGQAIIVDVRSDEEFKFVGHVPNSVLIPWAKGLDLQRNPEFPEALKAKVPLNKPVLFLCRSGKRSLLAVETAKKLGYQDAFSIYGGFEGEKDENGHRGKFDGWRFHALPWTQD
jgi:rhodanese-related sulfurtransferase